MEYRIIEKATNNVVRIALYDTAEKELLKLLWDTYIVKSKEYRVKYQYNYSNSQTITFTQKNGYIHEFTNVPVKCGYMDIDQMIKNRKGGE